MELSTIIWSWANQPYYNMRKSVFPVLICFFFLFSAFDKIRVFTCTFAKICFFRYPFPKSAFYRDPLKNFVFLTRPFNLRFFCDSLPKFAFLKSFHKILGNILDPLTKFAFCSAIVLTKFAFFFSQSCENIPAFFRDCLTKFAFFQSWNLYFLRFFEKMRVFPRSCDVISVFPAILWRNLCFERSLDKIESFPR